MVAGAPDFDPTGCHDEGGRFLVDSCLGLVSGLRRSGYFITAQKFWNGQAMYVSMKKQQVA
jgi:hypothetical protein